MRQLSRTFNQEVLAILSAIYTIKRAVLIFSIYNILRKGYLVKNRSANGSNASHCVLVY